MTAQDKPDRCRWCGKTYDQHEDDYPNRPTLRVPCGLLKTRFLAKPSAPQAESVPSGTDAAKFAKEYKGDWNAPFRENAAREWAKKLDAYYVTHMYAPYQERLAKGVEFLASQTAALADERDQWKKLANDTINCQYPPPMYLNPQLQERIAELERSNSLLRERLTAAEWIPVEDRMPDEHEIVWVVVHAKDYARAITRAVLRDKLGVWHLHETEFRRANGKRYWEVTHWMPQMPLPERPKNIPENKENQ